MNRCISPMLAGVVIAASPVLAADLPHRKPGVWEVKYLHGATLQYCIDAATDKLLLGIAGVLNPDECGKIDMQRSGDAITIDFACTSVDKPATAHTLVTGSFDSTYTITSTVQGRDDLPAPARTQTTEGTWLGP